ncbi:MAG: GNAT family N-acetyltransferase [Verrucomicrobiales bacterium]|nr:GNAT family N-acetyltransferase [Verrucomicrobiales bacterium]
MKSGISIGQIPVLHHPLPEEVHDSRSGDLKIRIVETVEEIEKLELPWRKLTGKFSAPFQTFTWNLAWYRHFRGTYDAPMVFLIEQDETIAAILPCYRKGRQIRLAGDRNGDYQDILTASQKTAFRALGAIFTRVKNDFSAYNFYFWKISSEGFLHAFFRADEEQSEEMLTVSEIHARCPTVSIKGGLESYLTSLPSKRRQDMRRSLKRLDKAMPRCWIQILRGDEIRVSDLENVAEFHADYFRKDGVSPLRDPALSGMLGEVSKDPDVGLQVSALIDQGKMLAVDIGFARGGKYYGYLIAFDPEFRSLAPGKCLLLNRIDTWTEEDDVEVLDFLSGDEPYKTGFTHGESYDVESVHWMQNRVRSRAVRATIVAGNFGRRVAKRALGRAALSR